mgnify:CR=1 FL=1
MAKRDYYEVLGVDKSASADEIKKHTVRKQSNIILIKIQEIKKQKKNLKKLQKAYEVLSNPDKRARYDQFDMLE